MGDQSNDRPLKRPRTRANASRSQAPQRSGSGVEATSDPTLQGSTAPREDDILARYMTVLWPASFGFRQISQPAPLPSPFSVFIHIWLNIEGDAFGRIRELYELIILNQIQLEAVFAEKFGSGSYAQLPGFLCWAEYILPYDQEDDGHNPKRLGGYWVENLGSTSVELDLRKAPSQNREYGIHNLKIYGLQKEPIFVANQATEFSYFIVNDFEQRFSVNGVPIAQGTVAGPLPDFAIIDIDGFFVLWWANQAGIDYAPQGKQEEVCAPPEEKQEVRGTKRSHDAFREYENLNDNARPVRRARIAEEVPAVDHNLETINHLQSGNLDLDFIRFGGHLVVEQLESQYSIPPLPSFDEDIVVDPLQPGGLITPFPTSARDLKSQTSKEPGKSDDLTWCAEYKRRVKECMERPGQEFPHTCQSVRLLNFDDVVLAIASVWQGCGAEGRGFAFSNADLFDEARTRRIERTRCILPRKPFIIPLLFNHATTFLDPETKSNKEPPPPISLTTEWKMKGELSNFQFPPIFDTANEGPTNPLIDHIILVVAQLSGWNDVTLTFFDSCEGKQNKDVIRRAARNVVRNSAWLLDPWPNFTEEVWEDSPRGAGTTSTLHTILNAWAVMLNIRLHIDWPKGRIGDFYQQALSLINLALGGQLDGWTIRAFFQCYGYAAPEAHETVVIQDLVPDAENQGIMNARSYPMYRGLLNAGLQEIYETDIKPTGEVPTNVQPPPSGTQRRLRSHKVQPGLQPQLGLEGQPILISQPVLGSQPILGGQSILGGQPVLEGQPDQQPPSRKQPGRKQPSRKQPSRKQPSRKQPSRSQPGRSQPGRKQPDPEYQPNLEGQQSLDDQPNSEGQPDQEDQPKQKGKAGRKPKAPPTGYSWETSLHRGLEQARLLQIQAAASTINPLQTPAALADEEVALPIAAVWDGLRNAGFNFAYGTTDCFRFNRSPDNLQRDMTVVLQPSPLIMPLLFNDEYPEDGDPPSGHNPIGHLMLAVAERPSATSQEVKLKFIDSLPSRDLLPRQRAAAQGLVRYSGWMGVDAQGHPLPTNPTFTEEWVSCPRQERGDTCGFYLIMNAWAYMLGIPIHTSPHRRNRTGQRSAKNFHATGIEIINLAVAGCMDTRTIQCFLNTYGYSSDQDLNAIVPPGAPPTQTIPTISTMRVTVENLQEIINELRQVAMIDAATAANNAGVTQ